MSLGQQNNKNFTMGYYHIIRLFLAECSAGRGKATVTMRVECVPAACEAEPA
jgi:hypothetical protein